MTVASISSDKKKGVYSDEFWEEINSMIPHQAFSKIIQSTHEPLCLFFRNFHSNQEKLQELLRNFFKKVHVELRDNTAFNRTRFYSLACRILINENLSKELSNETTPGLSGQIPYSPKAKVDNSQKYFDCLLKGMEQMNYEAKIVYVLGDIEGLNCDEISEILGISPDEVKLQLHKQRIQLMQKAKGLYFQDS